MTKTLLFLVLMGTFSFGGERNVISEHVVVKVYPYDDDGEMRASAMPELKPNSYLMRYKRRFEYLLMNVPEIHLPEKSAQRKEIWELYPDTVKLKQLYLNEYVHDENLVNYFKETIAPIDNPGLNIAQQYTDYEFMEVASKFFYCDKVKPDTSIQAHVCVGLNGVKEANWESDYTLLEAFCYEAIFTAFDSDSSQVWDSFIAEKTRASQKLKPITTSLDQYLEDVKLDVFQRMKSNKMLKKELRDYYELNKTNLSFTITN